MRKGVETAFWFYSFIVAILQKGKILRVCVTGQDPSERLDEKGG